MISEPLFQQPDYRRFWMMRTAASLSMQIQAVAVGWHVYDLTEDAFALGLVGLGQFLPALLLALPAGRPTATPGYSAGLRDVECDLPDRDRIPYLER